jgi:hypothetical protein
VNPLEGVFASPGPWYRSSLKAFEAALDDEVGAMVVPEGTQICRIPRHLGSARNLAQSLLSSTGFQQVMLKGSSLAENQLG